MTQTEITESGITEVPVAFMTPHNLKLLLTGRLPEIVIYQIEPDTELQQFIISEAQQVWDCIERKELPAPVSISDVRLLYRKDTGKVIEADENIYLAHKALLEAQQERKEAEHTEEEAKLILQSFMRDAAELRYNNQTLCTWRLNKGSAAYAVGPKPPTRVFLTKTPK